MERKYNPVDWFEIYVQDMDRAKKFYETVFQVKLTNLSNPGDSNMKMEVFPFSTEDLPNASGALVQIQGVPSGGNSTIVYFSCEDCAVEESRIKPAGGDIHNSKMPIGEYGFMSLVYDTEGNMIGLHSMK